MTLLFPMQRKSKHALTGYAMGLLCLLGLSIALGAAYYIYTGVREDIKKQRAVYAKQRTRSRLKDDTPLAIALVKTRHPDVEAECARHIKLYSNSVFASILREIQSWRVAVAGSPPSADLSGGGSPDPLRGERVYAVSYECIIISKTLNTVDIEPLKAGLYVLKRSYKVDLNQNKILRENADSILRTLGQSSWYQEMGGGS